MQSRTFGPCVCLLQMRHRLYVRFAYAHSSQFIFSTVFAQQQIVPFSWLACNRRFWQEWANVVYSRLPEIPFQLFTEWLDLQSICPILFLWQKHTSPPECTLEHFVLISCSCWSDKVLGNFVNGVTEYQEYRLIPQQTIKLCRIYKIEIWQNNKIVLKFKGVQSSFVPLTKLKYPTGGTLQSRPGKGTSPVTKKTTKLFSSLLISLFSLPCCSAVHLLEESPIDFSTVRGWSLIRVRLVQNINSQVSIATGQSCPAAVWLVERETGAVGMCWIWRWVHTECAVTKNWNFGGTSQNECMFAVALEKSCRYTDKWISFATALELIMPEF